MVLNLVLIVVLNLVLNLVVVILCSGLCTYPSYIDPHAGRGKRHQEGNTSGRRDRQKRQQGEETLSV